MPVQTAALWIDNIHLTAAVPEKKDITSLELKIAAKALPWIREIF